MIKTLQELARGRRLQVAASVIVSATVTLVGIYVATGDPALEFGPVAWRGDYETGDLSQWQAQSACTGNDLTVADVGNSCITVVDAPRREGAHAARFRIEPHTENASSSARAEVYLTRAQTGAFEGREWVYAWSTLFPMAGNDGWWSGGGDWNFFSQFHYADSACGAAIGLGVDATSGRPRLYLELIRHAKPQCSSDVELEKFDLGELELEHWYDFALRVRWSSDPRRGAVELWLDGEPVVGRTAWPTLHDDSRGVYWKQGFYRGASEATNTVIHDGSRRAAAHD